MMFSLQKSILGLSFRSLTKTLSIRYLPVFRKMEEKKTALVVVAPGVEEMEAVISIDVLRRGKVEVTVAGLNDAGPVQCSRMVTLVPEVALVDVISSNFDAVVLPGGLMAAEAFAKCPLIKECLSKQEKTGGIVAAICAAPIALNAHGIAEGRHLTSHPSVKDQMEKKYKYKEDRVVVDGNLITSRAPGTAFEFGLTLVEALRSRPAMLELLPPMLVENPPPSIGH